MVKRGFSLFELLIAIVFIVTALFPLLQAMGSTLLASSGSQSEIVALNLAESKMEQLKSRSFASITAEAKAAVPNFTGFARQVDITTPEVNLKDVVVAVYWSPTAASAESRVSFETYVTKF